jgi:Zn-dependent protease with chaperone function
MATTLPQTAIRIETERSAIRTTRPAVAAARWVTRVGVSLSGLGVAACMFVLVRLFETWRIGPHAPAHTAAVLGLRFSYPAANADALVILSLAIVGFIVAMMLLAGMAAEVLVSRRVYRGLASTRPLKMGDVFVIDDAEPRAFCAGLLRPRVYVTSGAVALLDDRALDAVLLHERHHAGRRDPLRLAAGRVVARALFFLPSLGRLHRQEEELAELCADDSAACAAPGNRSALARAMLSFTDAASDPAAGIDPARVDHLLGEAPQWNFPTLLCVTSLLTVGLIVGVAILAGRPAAGTATFGLPFLSSEPCIVMLALLPAIAAVFAALVPTRPRGHLLATA